MDEIESVSFEKQKIEFFKKKPKNTLDYCLFESEIYQKYKLTQKELKMISQFHLDQKVIDEIINLCYMYRNKIKRCNLFPVVFYKIILRYNFPISVREIEQKIKLKRSKYLKYMNIIQFYEKPPSFGESVITNACYILTKFLELIKTKQIRLEINLLGNKIQKIIEKVQFNNATCTEGFFDQEKYIKDTLITIRHKIENIITQKNDIEINFDEFFSDRVNKKVIALCLIKRLLSEYDIILTNHAIDFFYNIKQERIIKGMPLLEEYIKINKIIIN